MDESWKPSVMTQMKFLSMKYCKDCGDKRRLIERLFAIDDELCDDCYFAFIKSVRERHDWPAPGKRENQPAGWFFLDTHIYYSL